MAERIHILIRYELKKEPIEEAGEKHLVVPVISCTLPDGESIECEYPQGTIISKQGEFGATSGTSNTLIYNDKTFNLGLCPGGKIHGYEIIIFDQIKCTIMGQVRKILKKLGYLKPKFNTTSGYNVIWVNL